MRRKQLGPNGLPVPADKTAWGGLSIRFSEELWTMLKKLRGRFMQDSGQALDFPDVIRALIVRAAVQDATAPPQEPPGATINPPAPEGCPVCTEQEAGEDYECNHCGRKLAGSFATDLLRMKGELKPTDDLSTPAVVTPAPKAKKKRGK